MTGPPLVLAVLGGCAAVHTVTLVDGEPLVDGVPLYGTDTPTTPS